MSDAKETEQNQNDTENAKAKEVENRFSKMVDASSTLLKETFPLAYRFFREIKKCNK